MPGTKSLADVISTVQVFSLTRPSRLFNNSSHSLKESTSSRRGRVRLRSTTCASAATARLTAVPARRRYRSSTSRNCSRRCFLGAAGRTFQVHCDTRWRAPFATSTHRGSIRLTTSRPRRSATSRGIDIVLRELYSRTAAAEPGVVTEPDERRARAVSTPEVPRQLREADTSAHLSLISKRPLEGQPVTVPRAVHAATLEPISNPAPIRRSVAPISRRAAGFWAAPLQ